MPKPARLRHGAGQGLNSELTDGGPNLLAETNNVLGGLGSAVSEVLAGNCPVPIEFVGVEDRFTESGDYEKLLAKYGLSADNIVARAQQVLKRKL